MQIVDQLEVVEVEDQYSDRPSLTASAGHLLCPEFEQPAAREQARQLIRRGQPRYLVVEPDRLCDVV